MSVECDPPSRGTRRAIILSAAFLLVLLVSVAVVYLRRADPLVEFSPELNPIHVQDDQQWEESIIILEDAVNVTKGEGAYGSRVEITIASRTKEPIPQSDVRPLNL